MNRSTNMNFYLPTNADPMRIADLVYNFETIDSDVLTKNAQTLTAAQKTQIKSNLGISSSIDNMIPQKIIQEQSSSTSKTLNLGNNSRAFIVYITNAYTCQFCVIAMTNSSGALSLLEVGKGTAVTFNTATANKLIFDVGNTARQGTFLVMATSESILNGITLA